MIKMGGYVRVPVMQGYNMCHNIDGAKRLRYEQISYLSGFLASIKLKMYESAYAYEYDIDY